MTYYIIGYLVSFYLLQKVDQLDQRSETIYLTCENLLFSVMSWIMVMVILVTFLVENKK